MAPVLPVLLLGCSAPADAPAAAPERGDDAPLRVVAVNYPLQYMAGRIGGDRVRAELPAPAGEDPASWAPSAADILAMQTADLILLNGAGYAGWVGGATLPISRLVDTSAGFADRYVTVEDAASHTHGPAGAHSHGMLAFTTWLDPRLALEQGKAILAAMVRARPAWEEDFRAGFASLSDDLQALDVAAEEAFSLLAGRPLYASHPVYQYLARRYGLDVWSFHLEPDESPGADEWQRLRAARERHPARRMLWEAPPLPDTEAALRELGVDSLVFDPCGGRPADGDYLDVMRRNLERVRASTEPAPASILVPRDAPDADPAAVI